jgi:hypothetical protein
MNLHSDTFDHAPDLALHPQEGWNIGDLVSLLGSAFFQDQHSSGQVFGTPGEDSHNWVEQTTPFTCAVVSQEMILHAFGVNASETQLTYEATAHGWLTDGGTSMENMARLLDLHGVPSHTSYHGSVDALVSELAQGHKVMVAVDSGEMWKTGSPWEALFQTHGADHAVVVTGLDMRDPNHPQVFLNDPGDPHGAGKAYALDQFANAWADGGNMYVATNIAPADLTQHSLFGANFNPASGMYMDRNFWQSFLTSLASTVASEALSHSGFPWQSGEHASAFANPWESMSNADRNDLFMRI